MTAAGCYPSDLTDEEWARSAGQARRQYPTEPLVSYQINRQLSGWNRPPQVIRAFGAHGQKRS